MTGCEDKLLLLQAYVDGELDAANVLSLETHLRGCAACADQLARIQQTRRMLAQADLGHTAPQALRDRVEALMTSAPVERPAPKRISPGAMAFGKSWGSGLVTGLALSAALVLTLPQITRSGLEDQLVANHIRSLSVGNHLTDIATSDRHVVKPWFNGKIDFAPRVPELAAQGFPLVGGRLDVADGHEVAAIVYRRKLHTINLFIRPAPALSLGIGASSQHEGYSLLRWREGGLEYWAVSDISLAELEQFRRSFASEPSL